MGAARHNPSAGYSFSLYAVTALSSFSDTACSGLQTGNPDMAIHQCCYNLSDFISFWILSPKWKGRGGRRSSSMILSYLWILLSTADWDQTIIKKWKVPGKVTPPPPFIFKSLIYFILLLLQQIHVVCCSQGFWLMDFFSLHLRFHGCIFNILCYCETRLGLHLVLESRPKQQLEIELLGAAVWSKAFQCQLSQFDKSQSE